MRSSKPSKIGLFVTFFFAWTSPLNIFSTVKVFHEDHKNSIKSPLLIWRLPSEISSNFRHGQQGKKWNFLLFINILDWSHFIEGFHFQKLEEIYFLSTSSYLSEHNFVQFGNPGSKFQNRKYHNLQGFDDVRSKFNIIFDHSWTRELWKMQPCV